MIEDLFDLIERYIKTFVDFLALRPKRFFNAKNSDPSLYLTPYQFLVVTLIIGFFIYVSAYLLTQLPVHETSGQHTKYAQAFAYRILALLLLIVLVNSILFRAISRIWPLRGNATFSSIFELQCYMLATLLPAMILDLVLGPLFNELIKNEILQESSYLILFNLGNIIGLIGLIFWNIPGVAVVNGVSIKRVWASYIFWSVAVGVVIGILRGLYLVLTI